jgi:hypothetical protein
MAFLFIKNNVLEFLRIVSDRKNSRFEKNYQNEIIAIYIRNMKCTGLLLHTKVYLTVIFFS